MFIIVKFSKSYYHIELEEASSFLSMFHTPFGRFRFIRISSGLTISGDAFPGNLNAVFSNLDFCTGITDDEIIRGEQPDGINHDKQLTEFLLVTKNTNSKTKCK